MRSITTASVSKLLAVLFVLSLGCFGQAFDTQGGFQSQGGFSMPFNGGGTFITPQFFSMGVQCPQQTNGNCTNPTWPYSPVAGIRSLALAGPVVDWQVLETSNRIYNWTPLDQTLAIAAANGADYMFVFGYTPVWAATNPTQACNAAPIAACSPPSDVNADGTGTDLIAQNFVTDLIAHLKTLPTASQQAFKFFEVWNEPQGPAFFVGTYAQLARITVDVAAIIHASGLGILVSSPCPSAGGTSISNWFHNFFTDPTHPPYSSVDTINFHSYSYFPNKIPLASDAPAIVQDVLAQLLSLGLSPTAKPLMITEGGWGVDSATGFNNQGTLTDTTPSHLGFIAQYEALLASSGVSRFYWYAWDNNGGQGLITLGIVQPSGIAYGEIYNWLTGATIVAPATTDASGNVTIGITRPGGYVGEIVWNVQAPTNFTVPSQFTQYRDLGGNVNTNFSGFQATYIPKLLESGPPFIVHITSPTILPGGSTGVAYSQTLNVEQNVGTVQWQVRSGKSTLPPGLALDPVAGTISGTPTLGGNYNFLVGALDLGNGTAQSQPFSISITAPTITSGNPSNGQQGVVYPSFTFTASGGTAPYHWTLNSGTLPTGLSLSSGGVLSGTPSVANSYSFTVKVTDNVGAFAISPTYTVIILPPALIITNGLPPNGATTVAYSFTFTAGGGTPGYTWALNSGALPTGLSLSAGGVLSGTPSVANSYTFTVKVTDSVSTVVVSPSYTVIITQTAPPLVITNGTPPNGINGTAYSFTFLATGGVAPYTWALNSGAFPTGLSISAGGILSGTPSVSSGFTFTVKVTDSAATTVVSPSYTVTIVSPPPPLQITNGTPPNGTVGSAYNFQFTGSGGTPPYSWNLASGSLPAGLMLNSSTGLLNGSPTTANTYNFTVQLVDSATQSVTSPSYSIVISSSTSCGPPLWPCSVQDATSRIPSTIPKMGTDPNSGIGPTGANWVFTDPTMVGPGGANHYVRLTDFATAGRNARTYSAGGRNVFSNLSPNGRYYVVFNGYSQGCMWSFDPVEIRNATPGAVDANAARKEWCGFPISISSEGVEFPRRPTATPYTFYATGNSSAPTIGRFKIVQSANHALDPSPTSVNTEIADPTFTPLNPNASNCLNGQEATLTAATVSIDSNDDRIGLLFGPQDFNPWLVVEDLTLGCQWINSWTMQISSGWNNPTAKDVILDPVAQSFLQRTISLAVRDTSGNVTVTMNSALPSQTTVTDGKSRANISGCGNSLDGHGFLITAQTTTPTVTITYTSGITGSPGTFTGLSCTFKEGRGMHAGGIDHQGIYMGVELNQASRQNGGMFWNLNTSTLEACPIPCVGHGTDGWIYRYDDEDLPPEQRRAFDKSNLSSNHVCVVLGSTALQAHDSGNNMHGPTDVEEFVDSPLTNTPGSFLPTALYASEILGEICGPNQQGPGTIVRFGHSYASGWSSSTSGAIFQYQAVPQVSGDGKWAIWPADGMEYNSPLDGLSEVDRGFGNGLGAATCDHTLDVTISANTNGCRSDVILLELR
jgi:hypothetical protein